jgi:hypothetical protein
VEPALIVLCDDTPGRIAFLQPDNEEYKAFLNGLLDVYRAAKRASADQRLKEVGRAARVAELVDAVSALCVSLCKADDVQLKSDDETDHEFNNLVQEVARLMCDCELFTFVLYPEAGGTNNEAERSLRDAAQDRRTVVPAKLFVVLSDEQFWSVCWNLSNCIFPNSRFPVFKPNSKPGGRPVKACLTSF